MSNLELALKSIKSTWFLARPPAVVVNILHEVKPPWQLDFTVIAKLKVVLILVYRFLIMVHVMEMHNFLKKSLSLITSSGFR